MSRPSATTLTGWHTRFTAGLRVSTGDDEALALTARVLSIGPGARA